MTDMAKQLTSFLQLAGRNRRFRQSHLSLYSAILMCYIRSSCQNPFRVSRQELMEHSAIRSFATYHKCIKDLASAGCIKYEPSYHPKLASRVTLPDYDECHEE